MQGLILLLPAKDKRTKTCKTYQKSGISCRSCHPYCFMFSGAVILYRIQEIQNGHSPEGSGYCFTGYCAGSSGQIRKESKSGTLKKLIDRKKRTDQSSGGIAAPMRFIVTGSIKRLDKSNGIVIPDRREVYEFLWRNSCFIWIN